MRVPGPGNLLLSVSHDLRAPLRALDGLSNALLEDCGHSLSDAGLGYTKRIRSAAGQMTSLIEDLLNLARVSRAEIHPQKLDLGAEVARISKELQHQEPDRHVRFVIQQPAWAAADLTLIRTVLQNLWTTPGSSPPAATTPRSSSG